MLSQDDLAEQLTDLSAAAAALAAEVRQREGLPKRRLASTFAEAAGLNDKLQKLARKLKAGDDKK